MVLLQRVLWQGLFEIKGMQFTLAGVHPLPVCDVNVAVKHERHYSLVLFNDNTRS